MPEGFHAGSAWMDVKPNIDEAEWHAKIAAAVAGASSGTGVTAGGEIGQAISRNIEQGARSGATAAGAQINDSLSRAIEDAKPDLVRDADEIAHDVGGALGVGIGDGVDPGLADLDRKVKDKTKQTAKDAGNGMSPLLLSAFAAAGTFGPALLLAGTGAAVAGMGALIAKSNADIQAEYKTLASDVGRTLSGAVDPLVPAVQTAMVQADTSIRNLGPVLKSTFADAAPDIITAESGIVGLASNALPGLDTAINQSRGIVSGFFGELPVLGSGVGRFFTGLTTNAQSTETGIKDFVDVASSALGTLGHVAGSAAAALSTDFAAVTPVLNTTLGVIDKLASPPVVGGLLGMGAALKFDPGIATGLQKISNGLTSVAAKADGSTGLLGKAGGTAEKAAGGFGKMADVMGGPWGIALGAGIGLLGGLVSNLTQGVASVSDFTAAVAQDNGVVGSNTTAIIQKKLATLDLTTAQQDLGVSQTTLIEYAAGEADAQKIVRDAYDKKVAALKASGEVSAQNTTATVQGNIAAKAEADRLHDVLDKVDQVTAAVKGALKAQNDQNQEYLAATRSAGIFAGMVDTATTALQTHAQQTAINTVASLQLGDGQAQLGQHLSNILYTYQLTADAASGYGAVMTALHGATTSLDDAQNGLDQSLLNAKTSFKANSYSMDENTQAGINNRVALSAAAKQMVALGVANYQAHGSIDQANGVVNQQIEAFVKATGATGKQKTAIEGYLKSLAQIPPDVSTNVTANTAPATNALLRLVEQINHSSGTVTIYSNSQGLFAGGKALGPGKASGGPVTAGSMTPVGEHGEETAVFGQDAYILTHGQTTALQSHAPTPTATQNVTFNYYGPQHPGPEQQAAMMRQLAAALT